MKTLPAKPVHPRNGSSHQARGARLPVRQTLPVIAAALLFFGATGEALAGRQPARADLRVQLDAPTTADINLPETYTVTVTNLGRDTSASIVANVTFPLSNTSPHVFIMGAVTPLDGRCAVVGRTLNCNLAGLRKGWSTSFLFNYAAPVSTKPLLIAASASSSTADPVPGNNSASALPNLVYPSRAISTSSNTSVAVRSCTGTALTAFYECIQTPGSVPGKHLQQAVGMFGRNKPDLPGAEQVDHRLQGFGIVLDDSDPASREWSNSGCSGISRGVG